MSRKQNKEDKRLDQYAQKTDLQHVRDLTPMYLGGKDPVESDERLVMAPDRVDWVKVLYSPAALKCFDEILVNAEDQWVKTLGKSNIWITVDPKTSEISVKNDGSCIPIGQKKTTDGRELWLPQFLFCEFRTSGNYASTGQKDTGGMFGLGATLSTAFCKRMTIESVDIVSKRYYLQNIHDCLTKIDEPQIRKSTPEDKGPWTKITMLLNFVDFKMDKDKKLMDTYYKLLYMRAVHTSVYIHPARVYWNGDDIKIQLPRQLVAAHLRTRYGNAVENMQMVDLQMKSNKGAQWHICVGVQPPSEFEHLTLVNGLYVKQGGTPVQFVTDQIVAHVKDKYITLVKKHTRAKDLKFNRNMVLKYVFLMMMIRMDTPSFTGQRKDMIDTAQTEYAGITIPGTYLDLMWKYISQFIEMDLLDKSVATANKAARSKKKIKVKKCTQAAMAGTAQSQSCSLFIAEGDSAVGTLDKLITSSRDLGYNTYGVFSIQGVPVNARKEITFKVDPRTGKSVAVRSKKLLENERINALILTLGLDRGLSYESKAELQNLRYGCVIIATDQDVDGKGNIRSQLKNWFQTEFPALLRSGFVKFLVTPEVRAYHKSAAVKVQEFRTAADYHKWKETVDESDFEIVHYKGLGSHSNEEIANMSSRVRTMIVTTTADSKAEEAFEVYFGKDAGKRKIALRVPPQGSEEQFCKDNRLDVLDHLQTETKAYQIYNISRHIPDAIDGMLPTTRKIVCGARKKFSNGNKRCKVYQLAGYVTERVNYHHGDSSANSVIIGMAQDFPCSNELPLLRALSNFGSRKMGGTDAGHPRYIYTKLNNKLCDALLPDEDDCLLEYTYDDGKIGEPMRYIPVVPLAILESYKSPGHGWAATLWARDVDAVLQYVTRSVEAGKLADFKGDFDVSNCGTQLKLGIAKGIAQSLGQYTRCGADTITVTELPLRKWSEYLVNGNPDVSIKKKEERKKKDAADKEKETKKPWDDDPNITNVVDSSTDKVINISVTFKPGFLASLPVVKDDIDPVLRYLGLKQSLKSAINLIGLQGTVTEFPTYMAVLHQWFPLRKELYARRVDRRRMIVQLKLHMTEEQLRFARERHKYVLNGTSKKQQEDVTKEGKYQTFDHVLLTKPKFEDIVRLKTDQLRATILTGPKSNWDYLLKLSSLAFNIDGILKWEKQIAGYKAELAQFDKPEGFSGRREWLDDLKTLAAVIKRGRAEGWGAWDVKPKWV